MIPVLPLHAADSRHSAVRVNDRASTHPWMVNLVSLRLKNQNSAKLTMTSLLAAMGWPLLVAGRNLYCQTAASAFLSNPNPRPRTTRTSFGKPSSLTSTVTMATCTYGCVANGSAKSASTVWIGMGGVYDKGL